MAYEMHKCNVYKQQDILPGMPEIKISSDCTESLILPEGLLRIWLIEYDFPVHLPSTIEEVYIFGLYFNQPIFGPSGLGVLPNSIRILRITSPAFNHPLQLPRGLKNLHIGTGFNHPLDLPPGLETFEFIGDTIQWKLPEGLKSLWLENIELTRHVRLPASLEYVQITARESLDLPEGMKTLYYSRSANYSLSGNQIFPSTIKELSLSDLRYSNYFRPGPLEIVNISAVKKLILRNIQIGAVPDSTQELWVDRYSVFELPEHSNLKLISYDYYIRFDSRWMPSTFEELKLAAKKRSKKLN